MDHAFALFRDESERVCDEPYVGLELRLQLICEDQPLDEPPRNFNLFRDRLHPTMAYYEFVDPAALENSRAKRLLWPDRIHRAGYVDFVRRQYKDYPQDAILSAVVT